ncbi:MAG TPA: adenylate/guanylate cyclase domain-containing protein [Candidatus Acidoferrum sp.]|jgi:class 3 adenylate cyclase|nr:adenylate/guanylate cyclase domain-containing protein [Candidatus Acidoferrum sp.]
MQPGIVALRGAVTAAWEDDLRSVHQDGYDTGGDKEALVFIQRFYALVSQLRTPIQRAWGPGGLIHVADNPDVAGPGQRVSQTRIKLRNHGDLVAVEAFTYGDGTSKPNPSLGLDRELKVAAVGAFTFVQELYHTMVAFLQAALGVDLQLNGSAWLYEQIAASYFVAHGRWPTVGDLYQSATREFAVDEAFERVIAMFAPDETSNGETEAKLSLEQLHRCRDTQGELDTFVQAIRLAVDADQAVGRVTGAAAAGQLKLDPPATAKLGRLLSLAPDICREGEVVDGFSAWSFLPSYNVHFFRRAKTIDDYLGVVASLNPRDGSGDVALTAPGPVNGEVLPDGVVTFLMTDVVESTPIWLQKRAQMYAAMKRHDQLLTTAIEGNGGVVLKERGEGDSFFAVFLRATDAVAAAFDAQKALMSEPWTDQIPISVRMAVLTGEADAQDRDYRSPAVNRCAKLRRRAVGNQILVSETTYSIVADILRDDLRLVSVGKRRLEGHDRHEEVYVVQHPDVALEPAVAEDEI